MKLLTVRFEFQIEADVFGLHTLDPKAAAWLRQGMSDVEDLPGVTVTIEPLADLANPGGLTQVRKRTRGPNRATPAANGGITQKEAEEVLARLGTSNFRARRPRPFPSLTEATDKKSEAEPGTDAARGEDQQDTAPVVPPYRGDI